jgi:hypothetical protein
MLAIFAFFSIVSTLLVACLSIALVNVVIRRETAYLIEERIKMFVDNQRSPDGPLRSQNHGCDGEASDTLEVTRLSGLLQAAKPSMSSKQTIGETRPAWGHTNDCADIVEDSGKLDFRVLRALDQLKRSTLSQLKTFRSEVVLEQLSKEASVQITSSKPELLSSYCMKEGLFGEIKANFIPGSHRPVPVWRSSPETGRQVLPKAG